MEKGFNMENKAIMLLSQADLDDKELILSSELENSILEVEKLISKLRLQRQAYAKEILGGERTYENDNIKITKVEAFRKIADLEQIDQRFVKTQKSLNTQAVNEYYKENRQLPEGVTEVYSSGYIKLTFKDKEKEEKKKEDKIAEYKMREQAQQASKDFIKTFKANAKTR